jgi:hypothetical protein
MLVLASAEGVAGITAAATLLGAGGLALVTVYTNDRRLTDESKRHKLDLHHDREMADLKDLRTLLDEVASALDRARNARGRLESILPQPGAHSSTIKKELPDLAELIKESGLPMLALRPRVELRLGKADPIAVAVMSASESFVDIWEVLTLCANPQPAMEAIPNAVSDLTRRFTIAANEFVDAAVVRTGMVSMRDGS